MSVRQNVWMPRLSHVFVWPPTGHRGSAWVRPADNDAFVKTARRVCELYSEVIASLGLEGRSSEIRFMSDVGPKGQAEVEVTVNTEFLGGFESAHILLPRGIAELAPQARGVLVLDAVHGAVMRLAEARGWDPALLKTVRDRCLERNLDYTWESPWKASPHRRYQARAEFRLLDHGFGTTRIAVRDRRSGHVIGTSETAEAYCTQAGFKRSARTLRWDGSDRVTMAPFSGLLGQQDGQVAAEVNRLRPWTPWTEIPPLDVHVQLPTVTVAGAGPDAPEQGHEIRIIGGGPMNGVPRRYSVTLSRLLDRMKEHGETWWEDSDLAILDVEYHFSAAKPGIALRRGRNRLKATINRPVETIGAVRPGQVAHDDVLALVEAITRKQGLGPPPSL
jgi:hypothetical protein